MATETKTPPVKKREIFGWAMYDFANSSYTTVVISLLYSSFFVAHIVPEGSGARDTYWSVAIVASTILAIILSPLVGAICDFTGGKKRYLGYTTAICGISTALLFFVDPGEIWLAIVLIALSNCAFMLGEAFCASFLTDLANKKNMGMISGLGWGLGYFGGLASLIIVQLVITAEPESALAQYVNQNQVAMILIGAFYAIAALPTFLLVKERSRPVPGYEDAGMGKLFRAGVTELLQSWKLVKQYPTLFKFFLAFTVYMAGLEVVIKFIGIYANNELALETSELITMFLIIQISAAAGALGFGFLETKLGAKKTVLLTIVWWIAGILAIYWLQAIANAVGAEATTVFFVISVIAGSGIGSIQSSSRAVVGLLSPADRSAQMFGFWGMFMRVSIILGMLFGPVADMVGRRTALLLVVTYFLVGGIMLLFVPIDRESGEEAVA
jgi:UMF1 family MFS transporter